MSQQDFNKKTTSTKFRFRAIMNIAMGVLYLILAGAVVTMRKFGAVDLAPALAYGFCALLSLYGLFRLWRGIQDFKMSGDEVE